MPTARTDPELEYLLELDRRSKFRRRCQGSHQFNIAVSYVQQPVTPALFFRGGGFGAFWYNLGFGEILCQRSSGLQNFEGYSIGSANAVVQALGTPSLECVLEAALRVEKAVGAKVGSLDVLLRNFLEELLPCDVHHLIEGRVGIVCCDPNQYFTSRVLRKWSSKEDVIGAIIASSYIPFFLDGGLSDPMFGYVDGGLSRDLAVLLENKIATEIPSSWQEVMQAFSEERARELYDLGRSDAQAVPALKLIS